MGTEGGAASVVFHTGLWAFSWLVMCFLGVQQGPWGPVYPRWVCVPSTFGSTQRLHSVFTRRTHFPTVFLFSLGCFTCHCKPQVLQSTKTWSAFLCFLTWKTIPHPYKKTWCTELVISMTFSYGVCNTCGIMVHDVVNISEESLKIWHHITTVKQNLAPEEGKWNRISWNLWWPLTIIHHQKSYACPLSLTLL